MRRPARPQVCDVPASACALWQSHCDATNRDFNWRVRRLAAQRGTHSGPASAPAHAGAAGGWAGRAAMATAPAAPPAQPARLSRAEALASFSCEAVLGAVLRVHPVEAACPAGVRATLRHYQRQSLAFMLAMENVEDATLPRAEHTVSPLARLDPAANGGGAAEEPALRAGGWLCDAVGMGKTLVCACLIAADKEPRAAAPRAPPNTAREVRTTVVFAAVSLLGQWSDELAKWAPQLKVAMLEKNSKFSAAVVRDLVAGAYDVSASPSATLERAQLITLCAPTHMSTHFSRHALRPPPPLLGPGRGCHRW